MREHPILFSPPMVRRLLADQKSVTRRLDSRWARVKAGDRLWVKEGWRPKQHSSDQHAVTYYADGDVRVFHNSIIPPGWKAPKAAVNGQVTCLFMPRWASRILLECEEDTRAERLQDITEEDAKLEGVARVTWRGCVGECWKTYGEEFTRHSASARDSFFSLWGTLHSKAGERVEDNPTVYRVGKFHRLK